MLKALDDAMAWGDVPQLERLLAEPADALPPGWRAVAEVRLAVHHGRPVDALAAEALRRAREGDDPRLQVHALLSVVGTGAFDAHSESLLDKAAALCTDAGLHHEATQVLLVRAAAQHRLSRDVTGPLALLQRGWEEVDPDSATALRIATYAANLEGVRGDLAAAWVWVGRALAEPLPWRPGALLCRVLLTGAHLARMGGDEAAFDSYLARAGEQPMGHLEACNYWSLEYGRTRSPKAVEALAARAAPGARYWAHLLYARVLFEDGRPDEALAAVERLEEWSPDIGAYRDVLAAGAGRPVSVWRLGEALTRVAGVLEAGPMVARAQSLASRPQRALALQRLRWRHGLAPAEELLPTTATSHVVLGSFVLDQRPFAEGSQGALYGGRHLRWEAPVAVKVLKEGDGGSLEREAALLARLDHPHIVKVLEVGRVDAFAAACSGGAWAVGAPYLAMRRVAGGALTALRLRSPEEGLSATVLIREVLQALAHAHAVGVLHLDVKPANVLVEDGHALLSDFGVSSLLQGDPTGRIAGTPQYMAPEQWSAKRARLGPWTDVYGAACLAWWLLLGRRPFPQRGAAALRQAHRYGPRPRLPEGWGGPALQAWFDRALDPRPLWRFASAAHALQAFPVLEGLSEAPAVDEDADEPTVFATTIASAVEALPEPGGAMAAPGATPLAATWPPAAGRWAGMREGLAEPGRGALPGWGEVHQRLWDALRRSAEAGEVRVVRVEPRADVGWDLLGEALAFACRLEGGEAWVVDGMQAPGPRWSSLYGQLQGRVGVGTSSVSEIVQQRAPEVDREAMVRVDEGQAEAADGQVLAELARRLWGRRVAVMVVHGPAPWLDASFLAAVGGPMLVVVDDPAVPADQVLALPAWSSEELGALLDSVARLERRAREALIEVAAGDPDTAWRVVRQLVEEGALRPSDEGLRLATGAVVPRPRHDRLPQRLARVAEEAPLALRAGLVAWLVGRPVDDGEVLAVVGAVGSDPRGTWARHGLVDGQGRLFAAVGPLLSGMVSAADAGPWASWALERAPSVTERGRLLRRLERPAEAAQVLLGDARQSYERGALAEVEERLDEVLEATEEAEEAVLSPWYWLLRAYVSRSQGAVEVAAAYLRRAESPETATAVAAERRALAV